jgi:hypothetical protein
MMAIQLPDPREMILWERVGKLAWIVGAKKADNPFRKYQYVLGPGQTDIGIWSNKLHAWDKGWDKAAARANPRRMSLMIAYLPRRGWAHFVPEQRRRYWHPGRG